MTPCPSAKSPPRYTMISSSRHGNNDERLQQHTHTKHIQRKTRRVNPPRPKQLKHTPIPIHKPPHQRPRISIPTRCREVRIQHAPLRSELFQRHGDVRRCCQPGREWGGGYLERRRRRLPRQSSSCTMRATPVLMSADYLGRGRRGGRGLPLLAVWLSCSLGDRRRGRGEVPS
jgi:hypothetical protein